MNSPHYLSISIDRSPADVYAFAAQPKNLPQWASGLSGSIKQVGRDWVAESPMGEVTIKFAENNSVGVLDHEVTLKSGAKFYNPMRVQPNGSASEVVFTLYRLPGVSDEQFQNDVDRVTEDLKQLKRLLEK